MKVYFEDKFDADVLELLGERIREDNAFAERVWGSIANVVWTNGDGDDDGGHSFRSAGSLLAAIRGTAQEHMAHMEFFMTVPYGVIDPEFASAMATRGWNGVSLQAEGASDL